MVGISNDMKMYDSFEEFFQLATRSANGEHFSPYPYQKRLALTDHIPDILKIPTGAGKTEAAVLAIYLWRYVNKKSRHLIPKRLIYCLPMRVLVEQTVHRIQQWIKNLSLQDDVNVVMLMGGNVDKEYRKYPEKYTIIVGTQDMLLSRALNRGYNAKPFTWPIDFGLLNNDCMWVIDEIQMMGNGFTTSIQLDAFRKKIKTYVPCKTIWMSATINKAWFKTFDSKLENMVVFEIDNNDTNHEKFKVRHNAKKVINCLPPFNDKTYEKDVASDILEKHKQGSLTVIIVNTVKRAQKIFQQLKKIKSGPKILLVHSRFRMYDRRSLNKEIQSIITGDGLTNGSGTIVVSTQVIEAGVDISAMTLFTEIAPWNNLVQRFGRCNRRGEYNNSNIYLIDLDEDNYPPYEKTDIQKSRSMLENASGSASIISLPDENEEMLHKEVIRKQDLYGLFDTTPDLSGHYTDISRYVRSAEETSDVSVFWRNIKNYPHKIKMRRDELCSVPLSDIRKFRDSGKHVYEYDTIVGEWVSTNTFYPGQTLLIDSESGGYAHDLGWCLNSKDNVDIIHVDDVYSTKSDITKTDKDEESEDTHDADHASMSVGWITLNDHTAHVIRYMKSIVDKTSHIESLSDVMISVARYHDLGKAHHIFQETMTRDTDAKIIPKDEYWAKREGLRRHRRTNFRHEAVSALAFLKIYFQTEHSQLIAYLIAAHHGKVRLSMRNVPRRVNQRYLNANEEYILGIGKDGESLPIFLSSDAPRSTMSKEKIITPEYVPRYVKIDTDPAEVGSTTDCQSWIDMSLGLLEKYGPFRLAYLEALIRAADSRASEEEQKCIK